MSPRKDEPRGIEFDEFGEPIVDWRMNDAGEGEVAATAFGNASEATPHAVVEQFLALPPAAPAEPEASRPFSRDGRDYYVDPSGKLHSVDAGFDAAAEYPGLVPATAERVRQRDIQKRSGSLLDQVETFGHTAAATVAETAAGLYNFGHDMTVGFYGADSKVTGKDIAPGLYGDKEREQREANPTAAFLGAAVPDVAVSLIPFGGRVAAAAEASPLARAASTLATSIVTEAGNTVIEGDEFDLADSFGVYAPTQFVLETAGHGVLSGAARALGWTRNAVDAAVERARATAADVALRETDPVAQAELLRRSARTIYERSQTALDEALDTIDERVLGASDKLFSKQALKSTVSKNLDAQGDAVIDVAHRAADAAEVTGIAGVRKAANLLDGVRGSSGAVLFDALRQARGLIDEAAGDIDSPLVRETLDAIDQTLGDQVVWGRAARNYAEHAAEIARAGAPSPRVSVMDAAGREAVDGRLDLARRVASLTGDRKLAAAAEKAAAALGDADKVTGARLLGSNTTAAEIATLRETLERFPERAPKLKNTLGAALEKLDELTGGALPEAWTAERVERHIAERAAGSRAARETLDTQLDAVNGWVSTARRSKANTPSELARVESVLAQARALLDEIDDIPKAFKRVRDFDALPQTRAERVIDKVTGRVASSIASRSVSTVAGAAAGYAGGGTVGGIVGAAAGEFVNHALEPAVRARAERFARWLKAQLRKHRSKAAAGTSFYFAHELANDADDPSPNAAAAVAMLGAPLLFTRAMRRPMTLIEAMRALDDEYAKLPRGAASWWSDREPILERLFGNASDDGAVFVDRALDKLRGSGLDLHEPAAGKLVLAKVRENMGSERFDEALAQFKRNASAANGRSTRAAKTAPKKAEARAALGEVGVILERENGARYTEFTDRMRRRAKDPTPLTLGDVQYNILRLSTSVPDDFHGGWVWDPVKATSVRATPKTEAEIAAWQVAREREIAEKMGPLKARVEAALAGVDPEDRVARVTIEDETIRGLLRDALGMRAPTPRRDLDMATDATSRYRKQKKAFDEWRKAALDPGEYNATIEWQSMEYRDLNAFTREGRIPGKTPGGTVETKTRIVTMHLQSALNKAVKAGKNVPGRVTRGISMPHDDVVRLLRAKTVTAQGFMSTSIHSRTPRGFAMRRAREYEEVPVMLTIEQRTGVPLGQGEGELTLRPGTTFDVVWAEPAGNNGIVRAYLREVGESPLSASDVLRGIAGKIPTEAKIAGGLLAVHEIADNDDDDDDAVAAAVGGLALLYGGKGRIRVARSVEHRAFERWSSALTPVRRALDAARPTLDYIGRRGAAQEADAFARDVQRMKDSLIERAIELAPRVPVKDVRQFTDAWVDRVLTEAAENAPLDSPNARRVRALLAAERNGRSASGPLFDEYGGPLQSVKLKSQADAALERIPTGEIRDSAEVTTIGAGVKMRERLRGVDFKGDEDASRWIEDYVDDAVAENVDQFGGHVTEEVRDYYRAQARYELSLEIDFKRNVRFLESPATGGAGTGLQVREALRSFVGSDGGADYAKAIREQAGRGELGERHVNRYRSKMLAELAAAKIPNDYADAIVDDLVEAAKNGTPLGPALRDVVDALTENAELGYITEEQHRRAVDAFKEWAAAASDRYGLNINRALRKYAGDFDYRHINEAARGHRDESSVFVDDAKDLQLALDAAVADGYTLPGETYRGVLMSDEHLARIKAADVVEAHGFMSTTADPKYAERFIAGKEALKEDPTLNQVVFTVRQRNGIPFNVDEDEVILRAGTRFRIEPDPAGGNRFMLTEQIDHEPKLPSAINAKGALPWVAGGLAVVGSAADDDESGIAAAGAGWLGLLLAGRMAGKSKAFVEFAEQLVKREAPPTYEWVNQVAKDLAKTDIPKAERRELLEGLAHKVDYPGDDWPEAPQNPLLRQVSPGEGATPGGWFVGSDGKERYAKFLPESAAADEIANAQAYEDFGVRAVVPQKLDEPPKWVRNATEDEARAAGWGDLSTHAAFDEEPFRQVGGRSAIGTERLPPQWRTIDDVRGPVSPEVARDYVRGIPADLVLGSWDIMPNGGNLVTDGRRVMRLDSGEAGTRALRAFADPDNPLRAFGDVDEWEKLEQAVGMGRLERSVHNRGRDVYRQPRIPEHLISRVLMPESMAVIKADLLDGLGRVEQAVEAHGGPTGYVNMRFAHAPDEQRAQLADMIAKRLAFVRRNVDKIAGVAALGAAHWLAADTARTADAERAEQILDAARAEAAARDEAREAELDETREKLAFLSQQGRGQVRLAARALASRDGAGRTVEARLPGLTMSAGVARFLGRNATLAEAYEDKRALLDTLERDPMALVDEMAEGLAELQERAPALSSRLVEQTYKVMNFLRNKLPATVGATLARPEGATPNALALRQFALYYSAATEPATVLEDLAANRARREQIETLRELWPDTYTETKLALVEEMSRGRPSVNQRLRLDLLFDFGDALDAGLSSRLLALHAQAEAAQGPAGAPGQGAPGKVPERRTQASIAQASPTSSLQMGAARGAA